ncbi:MAG: ABC transporter permease subunit [Deltaproteobacteria bacterium]|nr:ABC transporter permease subunit [Deltaproteobacteria bacterium]
MLSYILRRLVGSVIVLYIIVTFAFFMIRIAPGGPFDQERALPPDILKNIEKKYHMDEPLWKQYLSYTKNVFFHLDLGPSYKYPSRDVNEFIADGFPVTLTLGFYALLVAIMIGVGMGLTAALRQNTRWDYTAMAFAMIGVSIPGFVLAPILQLVFSIGLQWLPVAGWDSWKQVILPAFALGAAYAAAIARLTRGGMLEIVRQDYIRTARAKGLPEKLIVLRHMIKGGLLPVVSYLGPAAAFLLSGSLVIEKIFDIPGLGRHFINSALNRDYTMTLGMAIFFSAMILVFNIVVDVLYTYLDPRVKYD